MVVRPTYRRDKCDGEFPNTLRHEFTPPDVGELLDWVLVLDDAGMKFPPPGTGVGDP
ncbi:hypothetical protein SBV1_3480009 [Verrucomicrobia bacterium]|nr:hypothetical protein SBV1_3480009 [Verrucomicrobiota bacterium]